MIETILLLVTISVCISTIWIVAKRSGKVEKDLESVKGDKENEENQNQIVSTYINMSSKQLLDRVLEKRKAAEKRLCSEDRLDR